MPSAQIFCCLRTLNTQNRKYEAYGESLSILEEYELSFPTGHRKQSIELVPRGLHETCCKMDWFRFIFRPLEAYLLVIRL